jgi:hypothetical protein
LDSQENFDVPHSWWQGRDSSCEDEDSDDGDDLDSIVEGGGLEEILHWPPEVLYNCIEHARVEKRRKADMRAADLGFGRKSKQVWRAAVGRENVEWRGGNGCEIGSKEGV